MRRGLVIGGLLMAFTVLHGQTLLKDVPTKGEWRFNPEKVWEVDRAGSDAFGRIGEILILNDGRVSVRDFDRNVSYLFDANGQHVKTFAPRGDQPGQLPHYLNRFQAADKIVLAAPDRLHYFSRDGVFERSVVNNLFLRFPLLFLNEHEFLYAPAVPRSPTHQRRLLLANLSSGEERPFVDFAESQAPEGGAGQGPMLMIPTLTAQVRVASEGGRLAFGRTDEYRILLADPTGRIVSRVSLDRHGISINTEDKQRLVGDVRLPDDAKQALVAQLPNQLTFFSHLDLADGFLRVFTVTGPGPAQSAQQIDFFSEKGEYVYRGVLTFGASLTFNGAGNLLLRGGHAYVVLDDGHGRRTLAKYRVNLPR